MKYLVVWKICNVQGRGKPMDYHTAKSWADAMNAKYGLGTHQLMAEKE